MKAIGKMIKTKEKGLSIKKKVINIKGNGKKIKERDAGQLIM